MIGPLKYIIESALVWKFDRANRELCEPAGRFLLDPIKSWPTFRADVAVAMGEGTTTKTVAETFIDLAERDLLPPVVIFTGGRQMQKTEFAWN